MPYVFNFTSRATIFNLMFPAMFVMVASPTINDLSELKKSDEPTKVVLVKTLKEFFKALEKEDYESASKHLVLPPNFKPEMLKVFIERREISKQGIERLEKEAKFGKAEQVFSAERAQAFAKKADVDVKKCYGFNHETDSATAEVMAVWRDGKFKICRLDDVGKLKPTPND